MHILFGILRFPPTLLWLLTLGNAPRTTNNPFNFRVIINRIQLEGNPADLVCILQPPHPVEGCPNDKMVVCPLS
jgi:hypothetical protein